jgi:hypothetical protein
MKTLTALLGFIACSACLESTSVGARAGGVPDPPPYTLQSVHPFLFFNDSGGFSASIPENAPLWNTVIGEGWAGQSSDSTLVRVAVAGAAGSYAPRRSIRLVVRKAKPLGDGRYQPGVAIEARTTHLAVLTSRSRTTVGFWISHTGCQPLLLAATLLGQTPTQTITRVVPFACGE